METKKAWDWIKEHKKGVLITTGTLVGVVVLGYFGVKTFNTNKVANDTILKLNDGATNYPWLKEPIFKPEFATEYHWVDNPIAKLDHVTITDLWKENGNYNEAILHNFTAADMGKVGEELMANIPEIKSDTLLSGVLDIPLNTKAE